MWRAALLLGVLLAPTAAAAWTVTLDAPPLAGRGHDLLVAACAGGPGRGQLLLAARNATLDVREGRYLPAFEEAACLDVRVRPDEDARRVELEARVRPEGGRAAAKALASVELRDLPFVACETAEVRATDGALLLRLPRGGAWTLVPALPGAALPPAAGLRVLELRAPPQEGVLVANDGPGVAPLAAWGLGDATLPPGARAFVPMPLPARILGLDVPRLAPGEAWTPEGVIRVGRTSFAAKPLVVEGRLAAYATPEGGIGPLLGLVDGARETLLVEAHTLTSVDVAAALARAADRGVAVHVLLEGAPPGGVPDVQRGLASALLARGVDVRAMGGEGARYRAMHAKLAVADARAVWVATENLNDGSATGFGLVVESATLAELVARLVEADLAGHDARAPEPGHAPATLLPRAGREPRAPAYEERGARNVTLVVSPDDPRALVRAVAGARLSLDVAMLRADADGEMTRALVAAARAGARVRVALDARHDDGRNAALVARLEALAEREGLDLRARLADPARTLHAKAFVVDGRLAYVGSMNWVRAAMAENREAGLLVESAGLARWMQAEMEKEWAEPASGVREVPAPPWVVVCAAALASLSLRRRCRRSPGRGRA